MNILSALLANPASSPGAVHPRGEKEFDSSFADLLGGGPQVGKPGAPSSKKEAAPEKGAVEDTGATATNLDEDECRVTEADAQPPHETAQKPADPAQPQQPTDGTVAVAAPIVPVAAPLAANDVAAPGAKGVAPAAVGQIAPAANVLQQAPTSGADATPNGDAAAAVGAVPATAPASDANRAPSPPDFPPGPIQASEPVRVTGPANDNSARQPAVASTMIAAQGGGGDAAFQQGGTADNPFATTVALAQPDASAASGEPLDFTENLEAAPALDDHTGANDSVLPSFGAGVAAPTTVRSTTLPTTPPVSQATAPVDQIGVEIARTIEKGDDTIRIQLKPVELGAVDVDLKIDSDGLVSAVIAADRPQTLDLLQRDVRSLERALQDAGLRTGDAALSFNLRGEGRGGDRQPPMQHGHQFSRDTNDMPPAIVATRAYAPRSTGEIDIQV
jgi:flagellar hook-length control protein FliK